MKFPKKYDKLYDFQKESYIKCRNLYDNNEKGMILSLDTGCGKTPTSLFVVESYSKKKLIVCPKMIQLQWQTEIKEWFNKDSLILKGTKAKRKKLYSKLDDYEYIIIGYETLRNDINEIDLINNIINRNVIIDEAHKLKNKKTKIYKTFKELSKRFNFALYLTGTPLTNGLLDINNLVNLINPKLIKRISDFVVWQKRTIGFGFNTKTFYEVVAYKNLDRYNALIEPIFYRKNKEDIETQMPEKIFKNYYIDQPKSYHKIKGLIIKEIGAFSGFTLLSMLDNDLNVIKESESESIQLLENDIKDIKSDKTKLETLINIIDDIGNKQVIIFSHYINSVRMITDELQKIFKDKVIENSLEMNKDQAREDFNNKKIDILVVTDSFSTGISLPDIEYHINYDLTPSLETWLQRQDRTHRLNSKNRTVIINLIGDIIEDKIMEIINEKKVLFDIVNGGTKINKINMYEELKKKI